MRNLIIQIGMGIVMTIPYVISILIIAVVCLGVLIYQAFEWLISKDGFGFNKKPNSVVSPYTKLDAEIDAAFSTKPLPKPYSPTDNPLYQMEKDYVDWKAKLPPFDREKIFAEVDASNVRMSNKTPGEAVAEVTFNEIVRTSEAKAVMKRIKDRMNGKIPRDKKGRFVKRTRVNTPVTRYGVPTDKRFGNQ